MLPGFIMSQLYGMGQVTQPAGFCSSPAEQGWCYSHPSYLFTQQLIVSTYYLPLCKQRGVECGVDGRWEVRNKDI